jgi:hypothetical protein
MQTANPFDDLNLLLPFYANGTLGSEDCIRIEESLAIDAALGDELRSIQDMAVLVQRGGRVFAPDDLSASPARLTTLLKQLNEDAVARHQSRLTGKFDGLRAVIDETLAWRWRRMATMAGLTLAIVPIGLLLLPKAPRSINDPYRTLSGPEGPAASTTDILMQPADTASSADLASLLSREGLAVVERRQGGLLVLRPSAGNRQQSIARLRASPLVAFAGPAA